MSGPVSEALFQRGVESENAGDIAGARAAYREVVARHPDHAEALASLAWLDAQAGDGDSARTWSERALGVDPANILARMAKASSRLRGGELDAAGHGLAQLYADPALTPLNRAIVLGLIGDLNDAQGDHARAFTAYEAANAQLRALFAGFAESGSATPLDHARRLARWFENADPAPWRTAPETAAPGDAPKQHVFLVGFPRSGTTLLETLLAGHPDVVTLEEKDPLASAADEFLTTDPGLTALSAIDADAAERHRAAYWSAVRGFGIEPAGRVFVDKLPLATVLLPLVAKLFPGAKVLFAIRDPRDVVLSCFRQRFGLNAAMAQFLTLQGTAEYYHSVMHLADLYRRTLLIPEQVVRYEQVVEDFEGTARGVCGFLGLDWDPRMADLAATARSRPIATPSAAQLAGGLDRGRHGAWARYRAQLAPILPILRPWVERFGYPPE